MNVYTNIPEHLREIVKSMVSIDRKYRCDPSDLIAKLEGYQRSDLENIINVINIKVTQGVAEADKYTVVNDF